VEGAERVPTVGAFVLAPVHRSWVDFLLMAVVIPRRMRYMGKSSLWESPPLFQRFIEMLGAFPVDREGADRDALRLAEGLIESGQPVVMFPEGKRKEGPVVEDLFDGPAWVACRQRVPIVPVAIGGSEDALPLGAKMIRFARVRVVIGEPIHPDVPVDGRVPRKAVSGVTEQIRQDLQKLYDEVR
jgi:1-acyl-sn-glycerol-3-phosphate acyltransferase